MASPNSPSPNVPVVPIVLPNDPSQNAASDAPMRWVEVAKAEQVSEGTAIEAVVGGQILAVFRDQGKLHALDGMCSHQGGPIAEGEVAAGCVTCPWHGWQYELDTGIQTINRQPLQQVFEVREENGVIEVRLPT